MHRRETTAGATIIAALIHHDAQKLQGHRRVRGNLQ
jgi:hypothetical protein